LETIVKLTSLVLLPSVSVLGHAQVNYGFPVSLTKSGFEAGEQASFVILPSESAPLSLNIIAPVEGEI